MPTTILPLPAEIEEHPGEFRLTPATVIQADGPNRQNADILQRLLAGATGFPLPVRAAEGAAENAIRLRLDPGLASLGDEGYRLEVKAEGVSLEAPTTTGIFYGIQSLRQLLPAEIESTTPLPGVDWRLPCLTVRDRPRFAWRGFMLDEGRHFHGQATVLQLLDLMALQKLNVFHWHLTEDQGWRIEIKKYPRLTEIGSRRAGTSRSMMAKDHDGQPHCGFYTQDQIRAIVAYAAERHILVVPEIEFPGHSLAALAAYPELSCTGGPFEVATGFGVFPDLYCAGKEAVFAFLQDVLDELLPLFPGPYVHIGGDEAPKKRWKACPDCQRRMREEGLADEHALQVYFTNRIMAYLEGKGRRAVGWNQILGPGLAEKAVVQYWIGSQKPLVEAIRGERRQVVMSTYLDTYLDHGYSLMPLSRAYRYEPVPAGLAGDEKDSVLGLEFPLWSEWVPNRARLDYQTFPRLTALAETGWTPKERKDLGDFRRRLGGFLARLDRLGVRYAPLAEVEPSKLRQWFGPLTIVRPQTRVAR
jgi:hexosaminidase